MKKFAIGCGIAALVLVAISIGATVVGVRWMKGQVADAERYSRNSEAMVAEYGDPPAFVPPADGQYDPDRVALFSEMRGRLQLAGENLRTESAEMAEGTTKGWWRGLRSVMRMLNAGAGYLATADSLLLEAGMSHGEYAHLQTLWLHGTRDQWPEEFAGAQPDHDGEKDFLKAFEDMAGSYRDEARLLLQAHARNARDAAEEAGADCDTCPAWIEYLDGQLEAARTRRSTVPMLDPLPESLALAFDQYRNQLAPTRPDDYGTWLMAILMVMELDDDGEGVNIQFGD